MAAILFHKKMPIDTTASIQSDLTEPMAHLSQRGPITSPELDRAIRKKRRSQTSVSKVTDSLAIPLSPSPNSVVREPIPSSAEHLSHCPKGHGQELLLEASAMSDVLAEIESADASVAHSKDVSSKVFQPLFETSKKLVAQMQSLMAFDLRIEPSDTQNLKRLAYKINCAFENQRALNMINTRMFAINYITNMFNFAKTRNLQKSLMKGRHQIVELQQTVHDLEQTVQALDSENEAQRVVADQLKHSIDTTRIVLTRTLLEYRKELKKQSEALKNQQPILDSIQKSKLNQDFLIDMGILILSVYSVNTFLVEYPLHVAGQVLMLKTPKLRKKFVQQGVKAFLVFCMIRKCRQIVDGYGFHNNVGSMLKYTKLAVSAAKSQVFK